MKVLVKIVFCFSVIVSSCVSTNFNIEMYRGKKEFEKILNFFIQKTPNDVRNVIGEPQKTEIKFDKNDKTSYDVLSYYYVYNFDKKQYECELLFIADKQKSKIIDVKYNSDYCYYLTMY